MTEQTKTYILSHPDDDAKAIIVALQAVPAVTAAPISLATLAQYLRKTGLILTLKEIVANPNASAEVAQGLTLFLDQLADMRAVYLDTTDEMIAGLVTRVLGGLKSLKQIDDAGILAIYALGGGLAYDVPSEQEITDLRTLSALDASAQSLRIKINNGAAAVNALIAAFQLRIDTRDATATEPSDDELKSAFAGAFA